MNRPNSGSYRDLWILGAVITVPFVLLSGPFAGYVVSQFIFIKYFNWPAWTIYLCVALGFFGSVVQVIRLINTIRSFDQKQK